MVTRHTQPGTLRVGTYHGPHRSRDPTFVTEYDVLITTYGTVTAEYRKPRNVLFNLRWFRLMLDEGISAMLSNILRSCADHIGQHISYGHIGHDNAKL